MNTKRKATESQRRKRRAIGRPSSTSAGVGRDVILAKTCELLQELAPAKVTRAEVARYANVDPSLIRYYFQDRSSLLIAAAGRLAQEFFSRLDKAEENIDGSAAELLRTRVHTLFDFIVEHPFFHRLLIDEITPLNSQAAKRMLEDFVQRTVAGHGALLAAGAREGELQEVNTVLLLFTVIGGCEFFTAAVPLLKIAAGRKIDEKVARREYRDFICDLMLYGVATRPR